MYVEKAIELSMAFFYICVFFININFLDNEKNTI